METYFGFVASTGCPVKFALICLCAVLCMIAKKKCELEVSHFTVVLVIYH